MAVLARDFYFERDDEDLSPNDRFIKPGKMKRDPVFT